MRALLPALLLLAGCMTSTAPRETPKSNAVPTGLWAWSAETPADELDVVIRREENHYSAKVEGEDWPVREVDGELRVGEADGNRLTVVSSADGSVLRGTFTQPTQAEGVWYQTMATPVELPRVAENRWRADLVVQARPHHVFLDVFADEGSGYAAVIRNPEANDVMGARVFTVRPGAPGEWFLLADPESDEPRHVLRRSANGGLVFSDSGLELAPASDELASHYYSRMPGASAAYTEPPSLGDGWTIASPEEAGFDRAKLDDLVAELAGNDPRPRHPQLLHSLLVSHRGKLVVEEYFYGHDRAMRHDTRSLGKVFGSVLIGALRQNGVAIDVREPVVVNTLQGAGLPVDDPRKAEITLHHLMTYTSGLDCAGDSESLGSEDRMWEQEKQPNFWLFTASLPVLHPPGDRYAYCSGSANMVGFVLARHGGRKVYKLFDEFIAEPLEFGPYHWALAPNGEGYLGGGPYMRPRDFLKVGAMYEMNGRWNDRQIVPADWVRESTRSFIEITPETTGTDQETFDNNYPGGGQGYIWRTDIVRAGDTTYRSYEASGNGGQLVIVVPELDLAVAMTGGNYGQGVVWSRWRNRIVGGLVIPALGTAQ